jgi:hypothetical protein
VTVSAIVRLFVTVTAIARAIVNALIVHYMSAIQEAVIVITHVRVIASVIVLKIAIVGIVKKRVIADKRRFYEFI